MADPKISNAVDRAEQAYAAATEVVEPKPVEAKPVGAKPIKAQPIGTTPVEAKAAEAKSVDTPPVEFPAKAKRGPQAAPAPVPAVVKASEPVRAAAEPVKVKPAAKPIATKPLPPKFSPPKPKPAPARISRPATATTDKPKLSQSPEFSQSKDKTMATQTTDFTARDTATGFKDVFADVKTKAKAAFEKGASSLGDYTDFAKGNVEAAVESGKILAAGLQELGGTYVAESKTAFEALTADAKELAAQKTPTDFFKVQSEIARKNFESAMAFGTKSSEAWMKLAGEAFAPLSGRVNLAVEKIKTTA